MHPDDGPKIKVTQPFQSEMAQNFNKTRHSIKFLDQMGVKKFDVSAKHMTELTKLNRLQDAKSKVDCGSSEMILALNKYH